MTRTLRNAQRVATILLGLCVPFLLILLVWDLMANPSPVPAVVTIAGLVMLCFFFSYVFVVPDDLTSSATDRTLSIASKIFVHTRKGMTPDAAMGACQIILPETLASAMCITDGKLGRGVRALSHRPARGAGYHAQRGFVQGDERVLARR
mgnify:CR=1 FL=1